MVNATRIVDIGYSTMNCDQSNPLRKSANLNTGRCQKAQTRPTMIADSDRACTALQMRLEKATPTHLFAQRADPENDSNHDCIQRYQRDHGSSDLPQSDLG